MSCGSILRYTKSTDISFKSECITIPLSIETLNTTVTNIKQNVINYISNSLDRLDIFENYRPV